MSHPSAAELRPVDLFDGLDDRELERWAQAAEVRRIEPGGLLAEQGRVQWAFHLVLEGTLEAQVVEAGAGPLTISRHHAPTWVGAVGALTGGVSGVRLQALTPVKVADVEPEPFKELARTQRLVLDRVLAQVRPVVGRIEAIEQGRERLQALGTMAAGLAHELNNPAAAARRAAADLAETVDVLSSTIGSFVESGIERVQAQELVELQREALARRATASALDALDAAEAEEELLGALEALGVPEPWTLSDTLARAGLDTAWLNRVGELAGPAAPAAVRWVAASLASGDLAAELAESTERIGSLVGAVKAYAYMDRGELVEADIHEGLETTLAVMAHKLKHTEIAVERSYDRGLPPVMMHGGELNQVWTNLFDNAIQALGERGTLTVATARDGPCIRVDIGDDGPGIDPALRERVFEPFFTTKEVGQGTGLGLDTARRIVVDRHGGSIDFDSSPGRTVFHVWIPLERDAAAQAPVDG